MAGEPRIIQICADCSGRASPARFHRSSAAKKLRRDACILWNHFCARCRYRGHSKRMHVSHTFPLLRAPRLCSADAWRQHRPRKEEDVNWLRHLVVRWGARNFSLVCPHCRRPASSLAFKRGRFMLGDENLVCEQCGKTSVVTFWRFEGLSCGADRTETRRHEPLANSRH